MEDVACGRVGDDGEDGCCWLAGASGGMLRKIAQSDVAVGSGRLWNPAGDKAAGFVKASMAMRDNGELGRARGARFMLRELEEWYASRRGKKGEEEENGIRVKGIWLSPSQRDSSGETGAGLSEKCTVRRRAGAK
uniref:Uncharacterized protein n=1 Tax=Parascaris univalens TaxID=6257 RepID=A0A915CHF3_PARUN